MLQDIETNVKNQYYTEKKDETLTKFFGTSFESYVGHDKPRALFDIP